MTKVLFSVKESEKLSGLSRGVVDNLRSGNLINVEKTSKLQLDYIEIIKMRVYKELCNHFTPQYSGKIFKRLIRLINKNPDAANKLVSTNFLALLYKEDNHSHETGFFFFNYNEYVGEKEIYKDTNVAQLERLSLFISTTPDEPPTQKIDIYDVTVIYLKGIREKIDENGQSIKGYFFKKSNSRFYTVS